MNDPDIDKKKAFAERLKKLRMTKGLSQRAFTKQIGLNYTQYNRYENGERIPSSEILSLLSDVLGVSVDYLLDGMQEDAVIADFEDREFLEIFKRAERLDQKDKALVKRFLKAFLNDTDLKKQYAS